jgi:hypothetical protein
MRTGDCLSGPPPVGSTVVRKAVRVFTGTGGYSLSAAFRFNEGYLDDGTGASYFP